MNNNSKNYPLILNIRCSDDRKKYISISKNNEYILVNDCRQEETTKLLKKIPKLNSSSIIGLYIFIFFTIGKGFLEPLLFNKAQHIWIRKSPNSLIVMLILEGISTSRSSNNLFREKSLFYQLIDLIRSPKRISAITGSMMHFKKMELKRLLMRDNTV